MSKHRRILVIDDNLSIHNDFRNVLLGQRKPDGHLEGLETALFREKVAKGSRITFEVDCAAQGQEGYAMAMEAVKAGRAICRRVRRCPHAARLGRH